LGERISNAEREEVIILMGSNKFISRTAFTLYFLAVVVVVLGLFAPISEQLLKWTSLK
jgi:hypothetical protein